MAAAILWTDIAKPPALDQVQELAYKIRYQMWDQAVQALTALGEPPPMISEEEHLLRDQIHDVLHPHHDKDFRIFRMA